MKTKLIILAMIVLVGSSVFGINLQSIDAKNIVKNFDKTIASITKNIDNDTADESSKVASGDINNLIKSVKVGEISEKYYDRDEYTSSTQSYKGDNGVKYTSIRKYSFYESEWFDVKTNSYTDPYTGKLLAYKKTDFDHLIPLHYANQHGASNWSTTKKKAYADDPTVGVCVNASDNRAKSDKGPSEWLPKQNKADYCYSWLILANEYNLTLSKKDINTIKKVLKESDIKDLSLINEY